MMGACRLSDWWNSCELREDVLVDCLDFLILLHYCQFAFLRAFFVKCLFEGLFVGKLKFWLNSEIGLPSGLRLPGGCWIWVVYGRFMLPEIRDDALKISDCSLVKDHHGFFLKIPWCKASKCATFGTVVAGFNGNMCEKYSILRSTRW